MPNNSTSIGLSDETIGAMMFIAFVLLWYASSIVVLMAMQMGRSNGNCDLERPSQLFVQNNRKEILEELVDKQKRDKLWDIYLGTSGEMNDELTRAERLRIRHIEKRLASFRSPPNLWSSEVDVSSSDPCLRPRRRSSLDQQILEEWKLLGEEMKSHENWPWPLQKLLLRRYLRRQ